MSKKSTPKTPDASGDRLRAADIDKARSAVKLLSDTDSEDVESGDETRSYELNESETSEHLYSSSIEGLFVIQEASTDSEAESTEDAQDVWEKAEDQGFSRLHLAAESGDTEAVRCLLNVDVLDTKHNTHLHVATLNGHVDVVNLLLSKNASVNSRNASGQTSLHLAAEIGHLAIAQLLLDSNADVHVTDKFMKTPIHIAAMHGYYELVRLLMNHSVVLICPGNRPLHLAAKCGHTEVVQLLLNYGENPDATNLDGNSPLHLASQNDHLDVAEVLLRNNADINIRNALSKTPLHIAAKKGQAELVKAMIDHQGEVNAVDRNGDTALHHAARNGHTTVVNVLLNQTTEKDSQILSQLAINRVHADELERRRNLIKPKAGVGHTSHLIADTLLSHSSTVDTVFKGQATPLHLAVEHGQAEIVGKENLTFSGAYMYVNAFNNNKMTALQLACQNGHTSIVEMLLDNHAIVDVMKQSEETPFYIAARNGHADISDLLLHRGVCDFLHWPIGRPSDTPLHVAVGNGHTEVVEIILKHSRRIFSNFTKDEHKIQENIKNFVEARGVILAELLTADGRRVSAGIVWTEENTPLELRGNRIARNALVLAASLGKPKMVQLLLSGDQCVYSEKDLFKSFTSMIDSISNESSLSDLKKYRNLTQVLINSSKFNVNHQGEVLNTLLHKVIALFKYSDTELNKNFNSIYYHIINDLIQMLFEKGADFNMKNSYGETPLIIASGKGYCNAIQILFDWEHTSGMKLDIDARNQSGATALIAAAERRHVSAVRLLINHKASLNLYDYCGFTALHTAVNEPNRNWFDLHFFCKELSNHREFDDDVYLRISSGDKPTWVEAPLDPRGVITKLEYMCEHDVKTTRIKEEIVKLLLANDETDVNAIDFRGNTPLDLAVKSSKQISSATFKALEDRGAIRNFLEPKDEAPIEVARVDERGRNPLHRLMISTSSFANFRSVPELLYSDTFGFMLHGILLGAENFMESAIATDDKGRIPLHYAVMQESSYDLVRILLNLGSKINAADIYGKTPLHYAVDHHYAEKSTPYKLLVQYGADENTKDKHGHTPRELKQLRESVHFNEYNAPKLAIGVKELYAATDTAQVLNTCHVIELSKRKLVETIRIFSISPRPQESPEKAIWNIWTENEYIRLNRRVSQLKPYVKQFIDRLADGIKDKDWRFECQPTLVGSAEEETKAVMSADFDCNFKLNKFSQHCDPFPHPLGPKGYFQLRRKTNEDTKSQSGEKFACFFNSDQCLLTNEVNSRFRILVEDVLSDPAFWQDEHLFERNLEDVSKHESEKQAGLCKTVPLRMINPVADEGDGFLFIDISMDIVPCVRVEGWWPEDPLPIGISPDVKSNGSTFVFDRPRSDPSNLRDAYFIFSETFVRISFAPVESQVIKESPFLMKAAYIVCKIILYSHPKTTYQLKTCLLFCMEALHARNNNIFSIIKCLTNALRCDGSETKNEDDITPGQLAFWVERIMFCFMEFSRHDVYPCYFMPSFRQRLSVLTFGDNTLQFQSLPSSEACQRDVENLSKFTLNVSFSIYLDLCPDDTAIDIPIYNSDDALTEGSLNAKRDPMWEQFDREEFIRKLSSRIVPAN